MPELDSRRGDAPWVAEHPYACSLLRGACGQLLPENSQTGLKAKSSAADKKNATSLEPKSNAHGKAQEVVQKEMKPVKSEATRPEITQVGRAQISKTRSFLTFET